MNDSSCKTNFLVLDYQHFRLRAPWSLDFLHKMRRRDTIWKGVKLSVIPSAVMCAGWSWSGLSNRSQLKNVFLEKLISRYQWNRSRIIWTVSHLKQNNHVVIKELFKIYFEHTFSNPLWCTKGKQSTVLTSMLPWQEKQSPVWQTSCSHVTQRAAVQMPFSCPRPVM